MLTIKLVNKAFFRKLLPATVAFCFLVQSFPILGAHAQLVPPTSLASPTIAQQTLPFLKGLTIHPNNALRFDFLITDTEVKNRNEVENLIKYFFSVLTIPEKDLWVNLSPYEENRILPENLKRTQIGVDLLAQDYLLKKITTELFNPQTEIGQKFWSSIQQEIYQTLNDPNASVNILRKIWIVPDSATIYEHQGSAYIVNSHLKVDLEEDQTVMPNAITALLRKEILPVIENEINEGERFAKLRQIYDAMILAVWYKKHLKNKLLEQVYVDKSKLKGVNQKEGDLINKIYSDYLSLFQQGSSEHIVENYDPATHDIVPRKYFSGGLLINPDRIKTTTNPATLPQNLINPDMSIYTVDLIEQTGQNSDKAMAVQISELIYVSFREYFEELEQRAIEAKKAFRNHTYTALEQKRKERKPLYGSWVDYVAKIVQEALGENETNEQFWQVIENEFLDSLSFKTQADRFAMLFLYSVKRKIFTSYGISIEPDNDRVFDLPTDPDVQTITTQINIPSKKISKETILEIVEILDLKLPLSNTDQMAQLTADLVNDRLFELNTRLPVESLDVLNITFNRDNREHALIHIKTQTETIPLLIAFENLETGLTIADALVGYQKVRNEFYSTTRSNFYIVTDRYEELEIYFAAMFPTESHAMFYSLIGFVHPLKIELRRRLRQHISKAGKIFTYTGAGPHTIAFGLEEFPFIFKVIQKSANREEVIDSFRQIHNIDRFGQFLDSWLYRDLTFPIDQFDLELIEQLTQNSSPEDVIITDSEITFKRLYVLRKVTPVNDYLATASKEKAVEVVLNVGWAIKNLLAMGLLPTDFSLRQFGVTSWGRIVYLNNAGLRSLYSVNVKKLSGSTVGPSTKNPIQTLSTTPVDNFFPGLLANSLQIPYEYQPIFNVVHGDIYTTQLWQDAQGKVVLPKGSTDLQQSSLAAQRFKQSLLHSLSGLTGNPQFSIISKELAVLELELGGLHFLRLEVPHAKARVLVVEPISPNIAAELHRQFKGVSFDIILSKSEIIEGEDGQKAPGINDRLKTLVGEEQYDYVLGYVNGAFDEEFFETAQLKGLVLFSTGVHNIDRDAASRFGTIVTNAPGPTTTTVTEQNIGLILDGLFHDQISAIKSANALSLSSFEQDDYDPEAVAQILWYQLLRKSLKLDDMYRFSQQGRYVRTGVSERATIYHDQLGQNLEASIDTSIGIVGLDDVGVSLIRLAIAHEIQTIYVDKKEYDQLDPEKKARLQSLIELIKKTSQTPDVSIEIIPVAFNRLIERSKYVLMTIKGSSAHQHEIPSDENTIIIDPSDIFVKSKETLRIKLAGLTLGIQGLGRIGYAVAQRLIAFGINLSIFQRDFDRTSYQTKLKHLRTISATQNNETNIGYTEDKGYFFANSNIVTALAPAKEKTNNWIDLEALEAFGTKTSRPERILVNVVRDRVDEDALRTHLVKNPDFQARLDVVAEEEKGDAGTRFVDENGTPLANIKITGHTAAAVQNVRALKIQKALNNLGHLIRGEIPENIVTRNHSAQEEQVDLFGLNFLRVTPANPKGSILVVEPIPEPLVAQLQRQFPEMELDIILPNSEISKVNGLAVSNIDLRLREILLNRQYDYVFGYCNINFDKEFFELSGIKGLILFSTIQSHVDLNAANENNVIVANFPGPTTTAIAEQNIGLILDGLFTNAVFENPHLNTQTLSSLFQITGDPYQNAQIIWYVLLKQVLRLDDMFDFGLRGGYVRTGMGEEATIYHDQLGQNSEANVRTNIGIVGLDETGVNLAEMAVAFEIANIYMIQEEYLKLSQSDQRRIQILIESIKRMSPTKDFSVEIKLVTESELYEHAKYVLRTPQASKSTHSQKHGNIIDAQNIHIDLNNLPVPSLAGTTVGIHGLGRIGQAVAQRLLVFGPNILINQRSPERAEYQRKLAQLQQLAGNRQLLFPALQYPYYVADKNDFFAQSNIVTTLAPSNPEMDGWVDQKALSKLGSQNNIPLRVLVNAVRERVDENGLVELLESQPDLEVRLEVIQNETRGDAHLRFKGTRGLVPKNLKVTGHTAAAVHQIRDLKIRKALSNLRRVIDGQKPENLLSDSAILTTQQDQNPVGGIKLDSKFLNLQILRDENDIPLPIEQQPVHKFHIDGFLPVIIDVKPALNLFQTLGLQNDSLQRNMT